VLKVAPLSLNLFWNKTVIDPELMSHNLCTQGFHLIEDFLRLEDYHSLQRKAENLHQEGLFTSAKIGLKVQSHQNMAIRTDKICWIDDASGEPAEQEYLRQTNHIANILNQTLYLGLVEFETHFASYQAGAFYKKHIDQFAAKKTRKISCVYYLNEDWQEQFGGALKLYNKEERLIQNVLPQGNRFICFNSELPHEVCITHRPRYSIAGWMKTRPISELSV
jgi:SM-20-related protein